MVAYGSRIVINGRLIFFPFIFFLLTNNVFHFSSHSLNFLFRSFYIYKFFFSI